MTKAGDAIFAGNLKPWIESFFALSLTTNLFATRECPPCAQHYTTNLISMIFSLPPVPTLIVSRPIAMMSTTLLLDFVVFSPPAAGRYLWA